MLQMNRVKMSNPLLRLAILIASSFNFAGSCLLVVIWNFNPFYYVLLIFALSVMIGVVMVDINKAVIYTYASMGIGIAMATAMFMAPYILLEEPVSRVNIAIMVFFGAIGRVILFGLIVYFLGALLGCFLAEKSLE